MSGLTKAASAAASARKPDFTVGATGVGLVFLAGLIGLVGFVFLVIAGYRLMLGTYTPVEAAALTGGVVTLIAIVLAYYGIRVFKTGHKSIAVLNPAHTQDDSVKDKIHKIMEEFSVPEFENLVKSNPKSSILLAAVAGILAADAIRPN